MLAALFPVSEMAQPHVVTALVAKRAELSGELGGFDERRVALKAHIANLDSVLRLSLS